MFKQWFDFSFIGNRNASDGDRRNDSSDPAFAFTESQPGASMSQGQDTAAPSADCVSFEQIYRRSGAKLPQLPYGILKVGEMINSHHLSGMTPEARRCSVLMALETVGAEIEDLLQDAMVRQRILNDYEAEQQDKLQRFEEIKADENRELQAELESLTNQYMARVQANLDQVAREQDEFRAWQRRKQEETQHIAEAAAVCVPEGLDSHGGSLSAVLERACAPRW